MIPVSIAPVIVISARRIVPVVIPRRPWIWILVPRVIPLIWISLIRVTLVRITLIRVPLIRISLIGIPLVGIALIWITLVWIGSGLIGISLVCRPVAPCLRSLPVFIFLPVVVSFLIEAV